MAPGKWIVIFLDPKGSGLKTHFLYNVSLAYKHLVLRIHIISKFVQYDILFLCMEHHFWGYVVIYKYGKP